MPQPPRFTTQHNWPAVAAGAATLLGMAGGALTITPLHVVGASFFGAVVTLFTHRVLLRRGPVPVTGETGEYERRQLRAAAWVTGVVVVASCIGIGGIIDHAARPLAGREGTDIIPISAVIGVVLGAIIARRTGPTGASDQRRRRDAESVAANDDSDSVG